MKTKVLMVGTGGYAGVYLNELLHSEHAAAQFELVGAVDPYAVQGANYEALCAKNVPFFDTVEEFYAAHTADLAIVVTPIHLHAYQASYCLLHGSHVLCEKPICSTLEDAEMMIDARDRSGKKLGIGFQWSYNEGILALKHDILDGKYGVIKQIRTIVFFPRDLAYYHRGSGWAGKRCTKDGKPLLDSVAFNATAHYLHNMLFLTGDAIDHAAEPAVLTGEVYRVNPIEMFDTCALRVQTAGGSELLFYATHAVPKTQGRSPEFVIEGTLGNATLTYAPEGPQLRGTFSDGTSKNYPKPDTGDIRKLYAMDEAIHGANTLTCGPETALPHLKCILALAELFPETPVFPENVTNFNETEQQYTVTGLGETLDACWKSGKLPSEVGAAWAIPARTKQF